MKLFFAMLLSACLLPAAMAQGFGFSDLLRSVTNAVSGNDKKPPTTSTSTLGVRGMDDASTPVANNPETTNTINVALQSWTVGAAQAQAAAAQRGLVAKVVQYRSDAGGAATPTQQP